MVKLLILFAICSVIPAFFIFVFLHGTKNRLALLRERCRVAPDRERAVLEYDVARKTFPASLVAGWFDFGPVSLSPESEERKNPSNPPLSS